MSDDILERLRKAADGTTHWEGCEKDHHICAAVAEIESLREQYAELSSTCEGFEEQRDKAYRKLDAIRNIVEGS